MTDGDAFNFVHCVDKATRMYNMAKMFEQVTHVTHVTYTNVCNICNVCGMAKMFEQPTRALNKQGSRRVTDV